MEYYKNDKPEVAKKNYSNYFCQNLKKYDKEFICFGSIVKINWESIHYDCLKRIN
jgi:hypothetical protein